MTPVPDTRDRVLIRRRTLRKSLASAYVKPEATAAGARLEIEILGERRATTVIEESPHDPGNERLRAE